MTPAKDGIEMKVGKLCGEVAGLQSEQVRVDNRLNNHSARIRAIERKLAVIVGVSAAIGALVGSASGSLLLKLFAGMGVAAKAVASVMP